MPQTKVELYPFSRALTFHRNQISKAKVSPGAVVMSADHVAAISELAEAKLEHYGIPEHARCGARFKYYTGPLDYQRTIVTVVSEVILIRDAEKWALETLALTQVPRRLFYTGQIIPTEEQDRYAFTLLANRLPTPGCSI